MGSHSKDSNGLWGVSMEQCVSVRKTLDSDIRRPRLPDLAGFTFLGYSLPLNPTGVTGPSNSPTCCLDQTRHRLFKSFLLQRTLPCVRDIYKDPEKCQLTTRPWHHIKRIMFYLSAVSFFTFKYGTAWFQTGQKSIWWSHRTAPKAPATMIIS